ncbi:MAG TPA: hypothetical protein VLM91_19060 [Candidatus Methylomirabilis sp.]|nr:hypothetical protein [Candidatus Methylomirabilis sp.]
MDGQRGRGLGPLDFLPPRPRLRLSLGGFRLAPGNLRSNCGLASLLLFAGRPFCSRFLLWLLGVCLRQVHRE